MRNITSEKIIKILTWNLNGAIDCIKSESYLECLHKSNLIYGDIIKTINPDFACLQEVHIIEKSYSQTKEISQISGYKYYREFPLDISHHFTNDNLKIGVSILSKYEIIGHEEYLVTNPAVKIIKHGELWRSHDKGFIAVKSNIPSIGSVNIISIHLLPIHRFYLDIKDRRILSLWKELDFKLSSYENSHTIIGGDFNTNDIIPVLSSLFNKNSFKDIKFNKDTHHNKHFDHIVISKDLHMLNNKVYDNYKYSDHYPCFAEVTV